MAKRSSVRWSAGDFFAVPLVDGTVAVGQVLDLTMENIVSVALTDLRSPVEAGNGTDEITPDRVIAAIATWRNPLDEGHWPIISHSPVILTRAKWPNEQYRARGWVGAKHYNTPLVEEFLSAFHALSPWDAWYEPDYFDKLLISPDKKPHSLVFTSRG